ncbi:MAG: thermonuclease family protein [Candidatus Aceula meridiana]|nr:thermonuclease family protein [Candidatus Aceula meridiana]
MKKNNLRIFLITLSFMSITTIISAQTVREPLFHSLSQEKNKTYKIEKVTKTGILKLDDGRYVKLIGLKNLPPCKKEFKRNPQGIIIEEYSPVIPVEELAYNFITELLEKKEVTLELDEQYRDMEGYILGYIFLKDGTFANAEILRNGYASLRISPPNLKYENELRQSYQEASREKRGLHGE